MSSFPRLGRLIATTALVGFAAIPALAESAFDAPAAFGARVSFSGPDRGPIYPGTEVEIGGQGFAPGQDVRLMRGATELAPGLKADADGKIAVNLTLPEDAVAGMHPVVVQTEAPDSAGIAELKISQPVPLTGEDKFVVEKRQLSAGLYQFALGQDGKALFVTATSGRGADARSSLLKVDAATLDVIAEGPVATAPAKGDAPATPISVYGIGADNASGTIWVTNTRQNTIAVYNQSDLSLVKQFDEGAADHGRDVMIDEGKGLAYVSAGGVEIFDTKTLDHVAQIEIASKERGGEFRAMGFALDTANQKLYTVSLTTPEIARIDLETRTVEVFAVPGILRGTAIDVDPATGTMFVVSQASDDLVAVDASGKVLFDVQVGANPHTISFNPANGTVMVGSRVSDTVAQVDAATGEILANIDSGSFPNFVDTAPDGTVYVVNKARGANDPEGDFIRKISPRS